MVGAKFVIRQVDLGREAPITIRGGQVNLWPSTVQRNDYGKGQGETYHSAPLSGTQEKGE